MNVENRGLIALVEILDKKVEELESKVEKECDLSIILLKCIATLEVVDLQKRLMAIGATQEQLIEIDRFINEI